MTAEYVLAYGPYIAAAVLALLAVIVWHRNLGPTPLTWLLFAGAVVLVAFEMYLRWALWHGDV